MNRSMLVYKIKHGNNSVFIKGINSFFSFLFHIDYVAAFQRLQRMRYFALFNMQIIYKFRNIFFFYPQRENYSYFQWIC